MRKGVHPKDSWEDGRGRTFCLLDLQHPGQCLAEAFLKGKTKGHKIPFQYWPYTSLADTCGVISRILLGGKWSKSLLSFISFCVLRFFLLLYSLNTHQLRFPSVKGTRNDEELRYCHYFRSHIPHASSHLL